MLICYTHASPLGNNNYGKYIAVSSYECYNNNGRCSDHSKSGQIQIRGRDTIHTYITYACTHDKAASTAFHPHKSTKHDLIQLF